MVRPIIMFVASVTVFMSLAACKSVTELTDANTTATETYEQSEATEPTPEPVVADNSGTDQSVFAEPDVPAPQSLGASSSGLGR